MDKPQEGKVYRLTGDSTTPSIANGNTWEESEVEEYHDDPVDLYGAEFEGHGTYEDYEPNPYDGTYSEM